MQAHRRALVSEAEFLALPESTERVELLDGEVIVSPSPSFWHQEILRRIVFSLGQWAVRQTHPVTVGQSPLDVRFGPDRILQPDAFVILDAVAADHAGPIARIPDLCVEVLSTGRLYDRVTKRFIYAQAGVREYWVVDEAQRRVVVFTHDGAGSFDGGAPFASDARLTSAVLVGLDLAVARLFVDADD